MTNSLNKAQLIGNLGHDPDSRTTKNGQLVVSFSVATSRARKKKANAKEPRERSEVTDWHDVVAWGRLGEIVASYAAKGRQVYVEGRLSTTSYTSEKDGQKHYRTRIVAETVKFLDAKGRNAGPATAPVPRDQTVADPADHDELEGEE